MIFLEAFLWGSGLSLGLCVGAVAGIFLKTAVYKILGVDGKLETMRLHETECLNAILDRNRISDYMSDTIARIADALECVDDVEVDDVEDEDDKDDSEDDSEAWKNGTKHE